MDINSVVWNCRQKLGGVGRGASKVRWSDGSMDIVEKWASEDDVGRFLIVWDRWRCPIGSGMTVRERTGWVWIFDQMGGYSDRMSSKFRMDG